MNDVNVAIHQNEEELPPFNPLSEAFHRNPYGELKRYRDRESIGVQPAVFGVTGRQTREWNIFRYADVSTILKDSRFIRELDRAIPPEQALPIPDAYKPLMESRNNWMLFKDAPDHTRLRGLVNTAFTPRVAAKLEPQIQHITNHLLSQTETGSEFEVVRDYAFPLPVIVIAELLGVPMEDREQFKNWSNDLFRTLDPIATMEDLAIGSQVVFALREYFSGVVKERTKSPKEDLISGLIQARDGAGKLTETELLDTCILLLVAGHETTVNLIANSILLMMQYEEAQSLLRQHPKYLPSTIEEVLRFEPPIQLTNRIVGEELEFHGHRMHPGESVNVWIASANRDPAVFAHPEQFDITRQPNRHLSFGMGAHFCLGAPLARLEGQIALQTFLNQFPNIQMADETVNWSASVLMRSLTNLPVLV